jgi:glycosyltransferase involved in cell wall biosynthesis
MPFLVLDSDVIYANPVIGIFAESLLNHFQSVELIGYESAGPNASITYKLTINDRLKFISLGPEGKFWDHFSNKQRTRSRLKNYIGKTDILILRLPSYKAYAIWKHLGRPRLTLQLFVGNPMFTASNWYENVLSYLFRKIRSILNDWRMRKISQYSQGPLVANSVSLQKVWSSKLGRDVNLVHTSSLSENDILKEVKLPVKLSDPIRLLFVGRISFEKGIRELFSALSILDNQREGCYTLDIVGAESDMGGLTLHQLAAQYGVSTQINYRGVIPFGEKLFEAYKNADVFILPSYHEGMPHAIWESMSQGTPVIATPVGGVGDFFQDTVDIIIINIKDSEGIAHAVRRLEGDEVLREKLIDNGLKKVIKITKESQSQEIVRILQEKWQEQPDVD